MPTHDVKRLRCPICDSRYRSDDLKEALIHRHPEPQSGELREHLMEFCARTKLGYYDWVTQTEEGKQWQAYRKKNFKREAGL